jgi:hypothetical protein
MLEAQSLSLVCSTVHVQAEVCLKPLEAQAQAQTEAKSEERRANFAAAAKAQLSVAYIRMLSGLWPWPTWRLRFCVFRCSSLFANSTVAVTFASLFASGL